MQLADRRRLGGSRRPDRDEACISRCTKVSLHGERKAAGAIALADRPRREPPRRRRSGNRIVPAKRPAHTAQARTWNPSEIWRGRRMPIWKSKMPTSFPQFSRGAAREGSPRWEPWVGREKGTSPGGAKESRRWKYGGFCRPSGAWRGGRFTCAPPALIGKGCASSYTPASHTISQ